ncbi:unnamed protein product [Blepharisma stoltei]|uniref:RRM domain-containing protein n=1 Tax=Blepharisma stoltei TaxID=1481888 RepID=A0AAU9IUR2_9CILI|nr:unnamed protein product [Blepharisma stoltei]
MEGEPVKKLKLSTGEGLSKLPNGMPIPATLPPEQPNIRPKQTKEEKKTQRRVFRKSGDEEWTDPTMEDWPENDYRAFVGDLGSEVTEEKLKNAFRKYPSVLKVKIVLDKRSGESKGYGFISFGSVDDYIKAMKEMNGKYICNRPIRLLKSDWKKRALFKH